MAIVDHPAIGSYGPRSAGAHREPSSGALAAHGAVRELRRFFRAQKDLQTALGWSAPTLREWLAEDPPSRPRVGNIRAALQLRDVAVAAGAWVSDPLTVGDWLLEPNGDLRGAIPAEIAVGLPRESVDLFIGDMALVAPRERALRGSVHLTPETLREALRDLAVKPMPARGGDGAVDLADLDEF